MSYTTVRDGLAAVVETQKPAIKEVLKYEPGSIQVSPLAWVLLDSYRRKTSGQITAMTWRFVVRVVSPITDSAEAEAELMQAALNVADAIDANPQFNGALVSGMAQSPDGQTGWVYVGAGVQAMKCRVVDVFCDAVEKTAYAGAITGG